MVTGHTPVVMAQVIVSQGKVIGGRDQRDSASVLAREVQMSQKSKRDIWMSLLRMTSKKVCVLKLPSIVLKVTLVYCAVFLVTGHISLSLSQFVCL